MVQAGGSLASLLLILALGACGSQGEEAPDERTDAGTREAEATAFTEERVEPEAGRQDLDIEAGLPADATEAATPEALPDPAASDASEFADEASEPDGGADAVDDAPVDPGAGSDAPDLAPVDVVIDVAPEPECAAPPIESEAVAQCTAGCPDALCLPSPDCTQPAAACLHLGGAPLTGVFRTVDGGQQWQPVLAWPGAGALTQAAGSPEAAAFDPSAPGRVYVATEAGLQRSDDAGDTWTPVLPIHCDLVQVHPVTGRVVALEPADGNMVLHVSDDLGATWVSSYVCLPGHCFVQGTKGQTYTLALRPDDPAVILLGGLFLGYSGLVNGRSNLVRTLDGGVTWEDQGLPMQNGEYRVMRLAFAPSKPSRVYATMKVGVRVYVSDNAGASWTALPQPGDPNTSFLAVDPTDALHVWRGYAFWPEGSGVVESRNGGQTWQAYAPSTVLGFGQIALGPDGPAWGLHQGYRIGGYDPNLWWDEPPTGPSRVLWHRTGQTWTSVQCGLPQLTGYDPLYPALHALVVDPLDPSRALALVRLSSWTVVCD